MSVIPKWGCDEHGKPLDWDRCRRCKSHGTTVVCQDPHGHRNGCGCPLVTCPKCNGHGSLRAAALARLAKAGHDYPGAPGHDPGDCFTSNCRHGCGAWAGPSRSGGRNGVDPFGPCPKNTAIRCEGCGHPMSDGTWEGPFATWPKAEADEWAARNLTSMEEREAWHSIHFSPCDEGCRHGGPGRYSHERDGLSGVIAAGEGNVPEFIRQGHYVEATWRLVDVRTLNGHLHDLRPENLAVLCLRCDIERRKAA